MNALHIAVSTTALCSSTACSTLLPVAVVEEALGFGAEAAPTQLGVELHGALVGGDDMPVAHVVVVLLLVGVL